MNRAGRKLCGILGCGLLLSSVLGACGTAPAVPVVPRSNPVAAESSVVQSLQKQLREREKRIDQLESQLNVLKMIDQDVQVRRKPARTPATLTPSE